ncbi:MAG: UDP-N-acetylglucosamine 2-epimerase (non-hydrolyzing) [Chloroflexi bacterium]|nr:UDP-N-acetylglucosamine 2-epimerase (non-hydrolyzing) [Chloroflexota bacterium]
MPKEIPVIHLIAAARPNFMKVAPLYHALKREEWCTPVLVHTGQHYDDNMSATFLRDLGLPDPDIHLNVGSGSHAEQTAGVMLAYEKVCLEKPPDWVVVVGDVNSTLACTITAKKLHLPVAHLEAGLRSRDRSMPEEINRIVTDALSDLLWTPSPDADENLVKEGVSEEKIVRVGNIMMDSYEMLREKIEAEQTLKTFNLDPQTYAVVTLHRNFNVDEQENLSVLVGQLLAVSESIAVLFPVHPRTRDRLEKYEFWEKINSATNLHLTEPLGYVPFMSLVRQSSLVITDSGGIQEETTYLDIPCLTVRNNTERPITISKGTNRLVQPDAIAQAVSDVLQGNWQRGVRPELWDGRTADRVASSLREVV